MALNETQLSVTASFGATSWKPGVADINPDTLIRIADDALYAAKNQGRNRTVYLTPQTT
jgi:PleD family two-component response regulator